MALKRVTVRRIDANVVSFPRMMLLSRVQLKFKDGARACLPARGESLPEAGLPAT